jgi:hypothetical protein
VAPFARKHLPAHLNPEKCGKHPGGRPSEYRPEYCETVLTAMSEGISLGAFAGVIGVARNTVYEWIKAHSQFADAVARARAAQQLAWERKLFRSRKGAETTAAIFALKNVAPEEWRDIRTTEHKHSFAVEMLTDAQLNAIASGVTPAEAGVIEGEFERVKG